MAQQLPLSLQLYFELSFEEFIAGNNAGLCARLQQSLIKKDERFYFIWGASGSGKTHLLQACCQYLSKNNESASYIPLRQLKQESADLLQGLEHLSLVCIDDIDLIAGDVAWEEAIFHLYNRIRDTQCLLIVTGQTAVHQLAIQLKDLRSRLSWGLVYQVHELTDEQKLRVLSKRAQGLGLNLSDVVAQFILTRCSRNMKQLDSILNQLDRASLSAQRKLTIPFVKSVLAV